MDIDIRPARAEEAQAIVSLVRSERMRPTGLDWRRFLVAVEGREVIGTVQLRKAGPELASLVVRKDRRRQGLGRRLVESRLAGVKGPVFLVAPREVAGFYWRCGFESWQPLDAPWLVAVDFALGQGPGALVSLLSGRRPRRMVVMARR